MFKSIERALAYFANIVAIITFFFAVFGRFGFKLDISNFGNAHNQALFIIIIFTLMSSFGSVYMLRERIDQKKPSFFLALLMLTIFAFTCGYVKEILSVPLNELISGGNITLSQFSGYFEFIVFVVVHYCFYIFPVMYPKKFGVFSLFLAVFTPGFWVGMPMLIGYLLWATIVFALLAGVR